MKKNVSHTSCFFSLLLMILSITACEKEYSYEGGNVPPTGVIIPVDTAQHLDTVTIDPGSLPPCTFCIASNDIQESTWSFKAGNSLLCGVVDTAIMLSLERNTFTFFGPSSCEADTGLIFTVSLGSNSLDRDITNLAAAGAVFYYYHTNAPYVLVGHNDQPMRLNITSYIHATKILTGTFSGSGFREDGRVVTISEGKFKFRII